MVRGSFVYVSLCTSFFNSPPTGQDATEAFEDVGHSDEARALLPDMYVGDFEVKEVGTTLLFPSLFTLSYSTCFRVSTSSQQLRKPNQSALQTLPLSTVQSKRSHKQRPVLFSLVLNSLMYFLPLGILGAYIAYRFYSTGSI